MRKPKQLSGFKTIWAAAQNKPIIAMIGDVEWIDAAEGEQPNGPKKFSVKAYNGGALQVSRWDYPVIVDLKGMKVARTVVANMFHDATRLVGHATDIHNDGGKLGIDGLVSATGSDAIEFLANAANGFPYQASIEAMPTQEPEFIEAGKSVTVNGQTFNGPVQIARKSKLYGIAFVPRGADENTSVKIAAEAASSTVRNRTMDPKLIEWIEAQGFDATTLNDKQVASFTATFAEIQAAKKTAAPIGNDGAALAGDDKWDLSTILGAHQDNLESVDAIIAKHEDDIADRTLVRTIRAEARDKIVSLKKQAITDKWSSEKFELESVKAQNAIEIKLIHAARPSGPAIHSSTRDLSQQVIEAALCQTVGLRDVEKHYDDKTLQAAHTAFRGRIGLKQLLTITAAANGMQCGPGFGIHAGNIREVLRFAVPIQAAFSTLSLPDLLSNVANKELLEGYKEEDQTWQEIATQRNVSDFKAVTSYRMLDSMEYSELAPDGRITHGSLGEENYTRQAKTYAKMFSITRTDIINDDLGAFDDLRTRIGAGAAKKFNKVFWTAFLDNSSFFTAGRGNYITGATTTLLTDNVGLQLGVTAFDALRTPAADGSKKIGDRVGGQASLLLVPPELETAAKIIFTNTNLGTGANSSANIFANKYRPVKVTQLSDSNYSGYSATAWYLLREARSYPAMVVSFLNGVAQPTVESAEADFDQLGIQFRGYHDFGCDKAEYLCGIKSKGSA